MDGNELTATAVFQEGPFLFLIERREFEISFASQVGAFPNGEKIYTNAGLFSPSKMGHIFVVPEMFISEILGQPTAYGNPKHQFSQE